MAHHSLRAAGSTASMGPAEPTSTGKAPEALKELGEHKQRLSRHAASDTAPRPPAADVTAAPIIASAS